MLSHKHYQAVKIGELLRSGNGSVASFKKGIEVNKTEYDDLDFKICLAGLYEYDPREYLYSDIFLILSMKRGVERNKEIEKIIKNFGI